MFEIDPDDPDAGACSGPLPGTDRGIVMARRATIRSIPPGFTLYRNNLRTAVGEVAEDGDVLELRGPFEATPGIPEFSVTIAGVELDLGEARPDPRAQFERARDALFDLECALSLDDTDPYRKRVYALRVELARIREIMGSP